MKTTILTLNFVLLFSLLGIAQTKNVDVDNLGFLYAYRSLPTEPRSPITFTYSVKVDATNIVKKNISIEEVADAVFVEGQVKVDNPQEAQMALSLSLGNIVIKSSEISERREEQKDRDGKVTGVNYYYKVNVVYTFDASCLVQYGAETLIKSALFAPSTNLFYTSSEYSSRKDAVDYWNNNREVLVSDFYRDLSLQAASRLSVTASSRYGFLSISKERDIIKIIDEKKHNENVPFRAASNALKTELEAMTPNVPLNREKINDLIEYFKSIPEKYTDPKLKADVRLRYSAYYNLCKIYLYLDEPENVGEYAELILSNGYDTKDCERMKKAAAELTETFEKTGIKTRHFNPDEYFSAE